MLLFQEEEFRRMQLGTPIVFLWILLLNFLIFLAARSRIGFISFLSDSFLNRNKRGKIGTIFPKTLDINTVVIGNPIQIPTGTAPRNSTTGIAAIIANTATSGIPKDRIK